MNVLDLFSGAAGGWSLGLHRAGFRTVAACEIDPERRRAYSANFPGVKVYDDVRALTADRLRADGISAIDVVAGSPPCQDASAANHRGQGIAGDRTGLFREAVRLVRELRPRWAVFENSPRLRTRGVDEVLLWLEEAGYAFWPLVVGADDLGAPHERKRMWLVAYAAGEPWRAGTGRQDREEADYGLAPSSRPDPDSAGLRHEPGRSRGEIREGAAVASHDADSHGDGQPDLAFNGEMAWILEHPWAGGIARRLRVADGVSAGLARFCRQAYGDAVLPQITEAIGRAILKTESVR